MRFKKNFFVSGGVHVLCTDCLKLRAVISRKTVVKTRYSLIDRIVGNVYIYIYIYFLRPIHSSNDFLRKIRYAAFESIHFANV